MKNYGIRRLANPNNWGFQTFDMTPKEKQKSRGQFQKGLVPWNKGTKGVMKANSGTFKKGNMPAQTAKADGEIRIRYQSKKSKQDPQKYIRISLGKWQLLSHYTWEKAHGPVPHGCIIAYKDGDTMNCELDNLMLMTRAENMERNSIQRYPPELKFTIKVVKRLKKLIEHEERKHERPSGSPVSDH